MDSIEGYFDAVKADVMAKAKINPENFGANIKIHGTQFPDLKLCKIAIVGISEEANKARAELYPLMWKFENTQVADLGDIIKPKNETERRYIVEEVVANLRSHGIVSILIGEHPADMVGVYNGLATTKQAQELVQICPQPDMDETSPIRQILLQKPNYLFNIEFMASQTYLLSPKTEKTLEQMYLGLNPLGSMRKNIGDTEPVFRSASMVQFDLLSIKGSELPHTQGLLPNGLFNHEAAILCRYAGISNNTHCILFTHCKAMLTGLDGQKQLAQMIWYFIEGYASRFNDEPQTNNPEFIVYRNQLPSSKHELVFYKSRKSNRWWMEIPHPYEKTSYFVACNYKDYEMVMKDEMPDRWWKAFQRLM